MQFLLLPIATCATIVLLWLAKPVLVPVLFALLIAQLLSPLVSRLERRIPGMLAVIFSMGLMAAIIGGTMTLIAKQISALETNLPTITSRITVAIDNLALELGRYFGLRGISQKVLLSNGLEGYVASGGSAALSALTFTISTLGEIALIVILTFLMLYYRRHFRRQIKILGERSGASSVGAALDRTVALGQSYVAGLSVVMLLVGVADTVGLLIIGSPFPAVFGLLGALAVLIPYVGFAIVAPTCTLIAWLATGSPGVAGGVLLVFCVVHLLEGNVISPYLVGARVNLNPLATIVAVLVGGQLWGPAGMVLFIPLTGILKLTLDSIPSAEPLCRLLGPVSDDDIKRRRPRSRGRDVAIVPTTLEPTP